MTKLIVAFRNFPNAPKNYSVICKHTCMAKQSKRVNYLFCDILRISTIVQLNTPNTAIIVLYTSIYVYVHMHIFAMPVYT
jgi:hypothetical protein